MSRPPPWTLDEHGRPERVPSAHENINRQAPKDPCADVPRGGPPVTPPPEEWRICDECGGHGADGPVPCVGCGGTGRERVVRLTTRTDPPGDYHVRVPEVAELLRECDAHRSRADQVADHLALVEAAYAAERKAHDETAKGLRWALEYGGYAVEAALDGMVTKWTRCPTCGVEPGDTCEGIDKDGRRFVAAPHDERRQRPTKMLRAALAAHASLRQPARKGEERSGDGE